MDVISKIILLFFLVTGFVFSQEKDTIKTYNLDQVTIESGYKVEAKIVTSLDEKKIETADASSIDNIVKLLPSAKVQTNSRGETLLFLRGAGERQISLFFDGIPMNIPWDNRIDLSLVPAEAVGEISIIKGVPSVVYGPNAVSGVVNINPRFSDLSKDFRKISGYLGNNNTSYFSGLYLNSSEKFSYLLTSSYKETDGFTLPGEFSNVDENSNIRSNSQKKIFNVYGKTNYNFSSKGSLGLSVMYSDAEKGIPPETDVTNPRYWRYPLWKRIMVGVNGKYLLSEAQDKVDFVFAATGFESRINQYSDATFSEIIDIEDGKDFTMNGRFTYSGLISNSSILKASINAFSTIHKEKIMSDNFAEQKYIQNILGIGAEYEYFFNRLVLIAGVGYDLSETPETGNKPAKDKLSDFTFNTGVVYPLNNSNSLHFSFGRKTRFPTLRESFSGALGRFIPNPNLKAEIAYSGDAGISSNFSNGKLEANAFLSFIHDGIVRASLPGGQFQRINKDVIRTAGVEINLNYKLNRFTTYFHFTYLSAVAKNSNGLFKDTLEYKPDIISLLQLQYILDEGIEAMTEFSLTRGEFGLKEGSEYFQQLPDYFLINLRLSYEFNIGDNITLRFFGRINNLLDKLYYSQWSLPEAGREFMGGVSFEF